MSARSKANQSTIEVNFVHGFHRILRRTDSEKFNVLSKWKKSARKCHKSPCYILLTPPPFQGIMYLLGFLLRMYKCNQATFSGP